MISAISRVALSTVVTVAVLIGCGNAPDETTASGGVPSVAEASAETSGHERMLTALAEIASRTDAENPFQGSGDAVEARRRLAALPSTATAKERWQALKEIGFQELRLGNEDKAIRHWREATDLLSSLPHEISPDEAGRTAFGLAVAHLRRGETLNCATRHNPQSCILPIRGAGVHVDQTDSRQAIDLLTVIAENTPRTELLSAKAIWLLNIAFMTVGGYPDEVPEALRVPPGIFGADDGFPSFPNIAQDLGLATFNLFGGMIVDDFSGDGHLDVMTSTFDTSGQMRFFENRGDATFVDRTIEAGLEGLYGGLNLVQADYDNDGDLDVLVLRGAWLSKAGRHPNSLLRNDRSGPDGPTRFTDVTFEAGLAEVSYPTQTASWADYDNDGDVDLYVGNEHGEQHFDGPCQLFRNNGADETGKVTFTDVAAEAGVDHRGFVKGVVWGDYDNDDWVDLYVSTLGGENRLYRNLGPDAEGRIRFADVAPALGVAGPIQSFPVWFFDYDNDGRLDLYVPSYQGQEDGVAMVAASYFGAAIPWELPSLYRGRADGSFDDVAASVGLLRYHLPMGANFGDIDNDGFLDFYLGTGYPDYEAVMPNVMYWNRQGKEFTDVTMSGGFGHLQKGHAIAFADFDHDGDQDVFQQMGGAFPGDRFGDAVFQNPGFGNRWIAIRLIGEDSNRAAIGARLRLEVVEGGNRREIYRHVNSGGSFGANPLRQTIGLGKAARVETLEVHWPATGLDQTFEGLEVDAFYEIREGASQPELRALP